MWGEFRALGKDNTVGVHDFPPQFTNCPLRRLQHFGRVTIGICLVGVGIHLSDVVQRRCAQYGVGYGVEQYVSIAVAEQMSIVIDVDATES